MPKKLGPNPKAEAARARKEETKAKKKDEVERKRDEAAWADDDKHIKAKEQRKKEAEAKRLAELERKAVNRTLADQEMEKIAKSTKGPRTKPTQAQIQSNQRAALLASLAAKVDGAKPEEGRATQEELEESKNPNFSEVQTIEAHGLDEAVAATEESKEELERHPERRRRKAFEEYFDEHLPEYRKLYPTMNRQQIKNKLFKEFQAAEENPMNKPHASYNDPQ